MPQFNKFVFNSNLYGGGQFPVTHYSTDTLVFEGFSLSDGTVMTMTDLKISGPSREFIEGGVPRGDGKFLIADYFREYQVEASGIVRKSTAALLDAELDTIRKSLRVTNGELDYTNAAGTVKRFVATLANPEGLFADRQGYHITFCPWTAVFRCFTPFPTARGYTSQTLSLSSSPENDVVVNAGTVRARPVFILIFTAATSITALTVANATTGESITYTGSVAANDIFEFDCENLRVLKNGTASAFTGGFPRLEVGSNVITYTVTGSSFAAIATAKYKMSYL